MSEQAGWRMALSTLGTPSAGVAEVVALAARYGCEGLELRAGEGQLAHVAAAAGERAQLRRTLDDAGLAVLCVASYVRVAAPGEDEPVVSSLLAHLRLAADLGGQGVRVFPGGEDKEQDGGPAPHGHPGDARAARRLRRVLPEAERLGVRVLLETHDSHPRGADVRRVLDLAGGAAATAAGSLGAIWDVVHTWRGGESPRESLEALGGWLAYPQVKDAVMTDGRPVPTLPGEGEVQLDEVRRVLLEAGYAGWVSLEWERAWHPHIGPVGPALERVRDWAGGGTPG